MYEGDVRAVELDRSMLVRRKIHIVERLVKDDRPIHNMGNYMSQDTPYSTAAAYLDAQAWYMGVLKTWPDVLRGTPTSDNSVNEAMIAMRGFFLAASCLTRLDRVLSFGR